jgi:hypothetical protein
MFCSRSRAARAVRSRAARAVRSRAARAVRFRAVRSRADGAVPCSPCGAVPCVPCGAVRLERSRVGPVRPMRCGPLLPVRTTRAMRFRADRMCGPCVAVPSSPCGVISESMGNLLCYLLSVVLFLHRSLVIVFVVMFFFIDRVLNVHYRSFNLGFKIWDSKFLFVSTHRPRRFSLAFLFGMLPC